MKIAVAGLGYVGLANAVMLAMEHQVVALDVNKAKVDALNLRRSPIADPDLGHCLAHCSLNLHATLDRQEAYQDAELVLIATPTDYDPLTDGFDTASIEAVIDDVLTVNPHATIVIKSTVPLGYTQRMATTLGTDKLIYSPEFLREGNAFHDVRHPSRIVVGQRSALGQQIADLLLTGTVHRDATVLLTDAGEAEAIKLFSNTYLAMRVAYFNELDSFSIRQELDSRQIIEGVGLDPRIGDHYNNPSFGYGGYCLPKDTRQLLASFGDTPQRLVQAIVDSNRTRKEFLTEEILKRKPRVVGVHRMLMKAGADNLRASSIQDIMHRLHASGVKLIVYEPTLDQVEYANAQVVGNLDRFKQSADLIISNRMSAELQDVADKLYTRDIYQRD